jgi:hypothetical protein
MSLQIIIRGKTNFGKTRSEQEKNLRKEGYIGMSDENLSKGEWVEKKLKEINGSQNSFLRQADLSEIK